MRILLFHTDSATIEDLTDSFSDYEVIVTKSVGHLPHLVAQLRPDLIVLGQEVLDSTCCDIAARLLQMGVPRLGIWMLNSNPPSGLELENILRRLEAIKSRAGNQTTYNGGGI